MACAHDFCCLEGKQLCLVALILVCPAQACGQGTWGGRWLTDTLASPAPRYSALAEQFSHQFPSHDLPSVLAKFSLPISLSEFRNPLAPPVQEVSRSSSGSPGTPRRVSVPHPGALQAPALLSLVGGAAEGALLSR